MEPLQPLGIADIGLAARHVLGVTRADKKHSERPCIEKLENRNPVDAGRFHDDGLDAAFRKPVNHPMQIGREGTKAADWLRCAIGPSAAICVVTPTLMAAGFGLTVGIVQATLDFDLSRFIINPPADMSGRAELRNWSDS
jgi:hypothetical protein